ncbi:MAG: helical backbone metal receptor [Acidobacteriota bacterium]
MRIVSLTCSNTEIVAALGRAGDLVGVDDHSDFPAAELEGLERVGPDLSIDVERVAALKPDLVLASLTVPGHEKVVERLEAAGLPFIAPAPERVVDVERDIRDIARRLDEVESGERVVVEFRRRLGLDRRRDAGIADRPASAGARRPRVAVQWWPKPVIVPGRRSWVQDLLHLAGADNVLDDDVQSRPMEDAELAARAPDAIVLSWCGVDHAKYRPEVVLDNPAFADTPAVRRGDVFTIREAWLGRPSPRLADGYDALRAFVTRWQAADG